MDLSNLKPSTGSTKINRRLGRGTGSGMGGTSTRGHKGAKSRSGYSQKIGFEGGQMPLHRRIPKFGFKNPNRVEYKSLNLDSLTDLVEKLKTTQISVDTLIENGLVGKRELIKILGRGELKAKLEVSAHAFSDSAKEAIENAGGKAIVLEKR
jgi:large subunit ribosomal protein L15